MVDSDDVLAPIGLQANVWFNAVVSLKANLGTNVSFDSEWNNIHSRDKDLKISAAKWLTLCFWSEGVNTIDASHIWVSLTYSKVRTILVQNGLARAATPKGHVIRAAKTEELFIHTAKSGEHFIPAESVCIRTEI